MRGNASLAYHLAGVSNAARSGVASGMADERLIKVVLHNRGEDVETPWAEDLGPTEDGGRLVRLDNVPFLHAKPTFGDVIVVQEDPAYEALAWDRAGVKWAEIGTRLVEDGGRYAMIVDYVADDLGRFEELGEWLGEHGLVPEGCFGPQHGKPGRLYLAVPRTRLVADVMAILAENRFGFGFTQVHPEPPAGTPPRAVSRDAMTRTDTRVATPARATTAKPVATAEKAKPKAKQPAPKPKQAAPKAKAKPVAKKTATKPAKKPAKLAKKPAKLAKPAKPAKKKSRR